MSEAERIVKQVQETFEEQWRVQEAMRAERRRLHEQLKALRHESIASDTDVQSGLYYDSDLFGENTEYFLIAGNKHYSFHYNHATNDFLEYPESRETREVGEPN